MRYFSERGIACAAIDFQGHGSAAQGADFADVTVAELGRQLIAAHGALPGPSVIVGHSMGALPAALCATARDVAGLVLIAPSPPGNLPGAKSVTPMPAGSICPIPTKTQVRDRFLGVADDVDVASVMDRLTPEGASILNDRYLLRVVVDAARQRAPGICIEAGRDNPERHPVGQDAAVARFLNLEFVHLADAVHCMMYSDRWVASARVIEGWYNKTFN
ncbi:alpha/beta hydrolase [Bordetella sp. N]|nr:alpha/beta hydrolase [Bordetella sp. N]